MKVKKSVLGILDVFLILLVIFSVAGVAARCVLTGENGVLAKTPESVSAAVQVLVTSIEGTSADYFSNGAEFSVGKVGSAGKIISSTVTPAEYFTENENGDIVIGYEDGEHGKIDVRCTVIVSGFYRDGIFLLKGEEPLLPGAKVSLSGDSIVVDALVIDTAEFEE